MKNVDAAKIRDMAEKIASQIMLTAMAGLCIRFIRAYMAKSVWFQTIWLTPFFTCAYARKRIVNRIKHECKFALFPR